MPKTPPYFPFYADDWSGGTNHLCMFTRACYLELLLFQWRNGHIPSEPLLRMQLCGITDTGQWERVWRHLSDKFEVDDQGRFRNPKMAEEREKALKAYKKMQEAAKATNEKRWGKSPTESVGDSPGDRPPIDNQNQNQNQNQKNNQSQKTKEEFASANSVIGSDDEMSVKEFFERWNAFAAKTPGIAGARKLTKDRAARIKRRIQADGWLADWLEASKCLPLPGDGWQPDLDWIIRNDQNVCLILEGKYDWRGKDDPAAQRLAQQKRKNAAKERIAKEAEAKKRRQDEGPSDIAKDFLGGE